MIGSLHLIVDPSFICSHWASHLRVNLLKRNSSQLDTGHNFEPTRMHGYKGSGPVRKILGADPELKGTAWCHIVKLEQPISGCQDGRRLVVLSFSEDDRRVRDHTPVDISDGANDGCCVTCRLSDLTQRGMERRSHQVRHRHGPISVSTAASLAKERQTDEQHMRIQSRVLICEVRV
jgi:hypothetical protein